MLRVTLFFLCSFVFSSVAHADLIIGFSPNDTFDGDVAGNTAGPFVDLATGTTFAIETVATSAGSALNSNSSSVTDKSGDLGMRGGGNNDAFNQNQFWTFKINKDINFRGLEFGSFGNDETFTLTSEAWANATFDAPHEEVEFSSNGTSGTFTFGAGASNDKDDFVAEDLSLSMDVFVAAGQEITLKYFDGSVTPGSATLEDLKINAISAVPEPASIGILCALGGGFLVRRRYLSRKKNAEENSAEA